LWKKAILTDSIKACLSVIFLIFNFHITFGQQDTSAKTKNENDGYLITPKKTSVVAFPFLSYTPETSLGIGGGGVLSFSPGNKDSINISAKSMISLFAYYTLKKQFKAELYGNLYWNANKNVIEGETDYIRYSYPYAGIGNDLSRDSLEWYSMQSGLFWGSYQRKVAKHLYIGPRYWLEKLKILELDSTGALLYTQPIGIEGGWIHGAGVKVSYDSRSDNYFPEKGYYLTCNGMYFPTWAGSQYNYGQLWADLRMFHHVNHKVVFASNLVVKMMVGNSPFQKLPSYGSKSYLRGLIEGSGRDNYLWMIQQEIRYPIPAKRPSLRRFILNASFATGRTAEDAQGFFSLRNNAWSASVGGRFRLFKDSNLSLRMDFGFSKGTNGTYAVFNEAF